MILDLIDKFHADILSHNCRPKVCGGAIRDLIIGKPINDVDMYIESMNFGTFTRQLNANNIPYKIKTSKMKGVSYKAVNKNITQVIAFQYQGKDFDGIFTIDNNFGAIFDSYDNNLCKMGYNVDLKIIVTKPEAIKDWRNKTITKNPKVTMDCWNYSIKKHIPKMLLKFPDYKVIVNGKDITSNFSGQYNNNIRTSVKLMQSKNPCAEMALDDPVDWGSDTDLYCGCINPNTTFNEAFGNTFKYCKTCCKEKL